MLARQPEAAARPEVHGPPKERATTAHSSGTESSWRYRHRVIRFVRINDVQKAAGAVAEFIIRIASAA